MGASKTRKRKLNFIPVAYEAEIFKDRDYLLHLPNGETVCVAYDDEEGPTFHVIMWPGENKTYIEAQNHSHFENAGEMR